MINIEVLLQAAEFIEKQNAKTTYHLIDTLSPLSTSSSSSSSSPSSSSSSSPSCLNENGNGNASSQAHDHFKTSNAIAIKTSNSKIQEQLNAYAAKSGRLDRDGGQLTTSITPYQFTSTGGVGMHRGNMNVSPTLPYPSPSSSSCSSSSSSSSSTASSFENVRFNSSNLANMNGRGASNSKGSTNNNNSSSVNLKLEEIKRDKAIHNTLEKNRRAHLKDCFENLQNELPQYKDKKVTNLLILNYTLKFIEQAKRKDRENELEKQRLLKRQTQLRQTLKKLIGELDAENFDYKAWISANKQDSQQELQANEAEQLAEAEVARRREQAEEQQLADEAEAEDDFNYDEFNYSGSQPDDDSSSYGKKKTTTSNKKAAPMLPIGQRKRASNSLTIKTSVKPNQVSAAAEKQKEQILSTSTGRNRHFSCDENTMRQRRKRHSETQGTCSPSNVLGNEYQDNDEDYYAEDSNDSNFVAHATSAQLEEDDENSHSSNQLVINESDDQQQEQHTMQSSNVASQSVSPSLSLSAKKKRGRPSTQVNEFNKSTNNTAKMNATSSASATIPANSMTAMPTGTTISASETKSGEKFSIIKTDLVSSPLNGKLFSGTNSSNQLTQLTKIPSASSNGPTRFSFSNSTTTTCQTGPAKFVVLRNNTGEQTSISSVSTASSSTTNGSPKSILLLNQKSAADLAASNITQQQHHHHNHHIHQQQQQQQQQQQMHQQQQQRINLDQFTSSNLLSQHQLNMAAAAAASNFFQFQHHQLFKPISSPAANNSFSNTSQSDAACVSLNTQTSLSPKTLTTTVAQAGSNQQNKSPPATDQTSLANTLNDYVEMLKSNQKQQMLNQKQTPLSPFTMFQLATAAAAANKTPSTRTITLQKQQKQPVTVTPSPSPSPTLADTGKSS